MKMSRCYTDFSKRFIFVLLAYLYSGHSLANTNEWSSASQVMVESTALVLGIVNDNHADTEKKAAIIDSLSAVVDYAVIARGVMGKYYRRASKEQYNLFREEFQSSLENAVANALLSFSIDDYALQPSSGDDSRVGREKVLIKVKSGNTSYDIQYTLSNKSGQWQVTNISLDGINMGLAFRNQFIAGMGKYKNDIDQVIANWNLPN